MSTVSVDAVAEARAPRTLAAAGFVYVLAWFAGLATAPAAPSPDAADRTIQAFYADNGTGNCSGTFSGAQLANTGVMQPGATKLFCAVVAIPAGAASSTYDLYFRAASPTTAQRQPRLPHFALSRWARQRG